MKIKKLLSMLLIAALCLGAIPAGAFAQEESLPQEAAAEAAGSPADSPVTAVLPEGEALTADGFRYWINEAGEVTISGYKGDIADLVIPAAIDGKRVSAIDYSAFSNNSRLTSVVIEEGVGVIGHSAFYNCANLSKIDLPSTITRIDSGAFSACALTNTDGFKKLTNLTNHSLELDHNQITDVSGLSGIKVEIINLSYNEELKNIAPLANNSDLESINLYGTAVSEEDAWNELVRPEDFEKSVFDIGQEQHWMVEPTVYLSDGAEFSTKALQFTSTHPEVAEITTLTEAHGPSPMTIKAAGTTEITVTYKNYKSKKFKITVKDVTQGPEAGDPAASIPQLSVQPSPDGNRYLELKENGELWDCSGDVPVLVMKNVAKVDPSSGFITSLEKTMLLITDRDDGLWTLVYQKGQAPVLSQKMDQVKDYVDNLNMSSSPAGGILLNRTVYALRADNTLSRLNSDGTLSDNLLENVKEISLLYTGSMGGSPSGAAAILLDGTVQVLYDSGRYGEQGFVPVTNAKDALSFTGKNQYVDKDGAVYKINVGFNSADNNNLLASVSRLMGDAVQRFSTGYDSFYVMADGSTWYYNHKEKRIEVGDMTIAEDPIIIVPGKEVAFLDDENNLWSYSTELGKEKAVLKDSGVIRIGVSEQGTDYRYLKSNGDVVDYKTRKILSQRVKELYNDYLLYEDGTVTYRDKLILDNVVRISNESGAITNLADSAPCFMTRVDGSVWMHTTEKPAVVTKVANYPEDTVVRVTGVSLDKITLELTMGDAAKQLSATVTPADAGSKAVKWTSSDEKIAKVDDNGMVTAVGAGKATITATTVDGGFTASCAVSVNKPIVHVTGVALDKTAIGPMTIGYYETLTATVSPAYADNQAVAWSTDNADVAAVDQSGEITSVGAGSATITATTADGGFTASCTVTVDAPVIADATDPVVPDKPSDPVPVSNTEITITVPSETIASIPALEGARLAVRSVNNSGIAEDQAVTQKAEQAVSEGIASSAGIADADVLEILDFAFVDAETGEEVPFDGTQANVSVRLTLKITPVQRDCYDYFQVYALNDDGTLGEKIADRLTADSENNITADARHFSMYILVGVNEAAAPGGDPGTGEIPEPGKNEPIGTEVTISQPGSNAGTGILTDPHSSAYLCMGLLILAAAGTAVFVRRRNAR